ncbi:MAG: Gfo/Idh/MocA family oxidoreductase [Chloroflexi bacterium]|nr:Gfo/Idh/MocA family oxidoreductase [Chloroflexota bacterium]
MEPVRLGVVGCGVIGRVHLQMATDSPLIDVVAVADLREQAAREAAERFGVGTVYTDADDLFADPQVEAVVLALPARDRTELALRAFAAGKHVLTEKPVAMNAGEVERMIRARGDLVAGCCSSRFRFLPSARAASDLIASGALGDLRVLHCRAVKAAGRPPEMTPPAWRLNRSLNGGGILTNWGCYDLDYLLGITGWSLRPRLVLAQTWTVPPQFESHVAPGSDAETHFAAFIRCEDGTVITLERGEYMAAQTEEAWRVVGTKGSLRLQMTPGQGKAVVHDDTTTEDGVVSRTIWEGDEDYAMTHAGPVQDFAAAIREGRQPETSLERALIVQKITDAIYASAERGVAVEIE